MILQKIVPFLLVSLVITADAKSQNTEVKELRLEAYKRIDKPARKEVSGITKSRRFENTFWVHGDSGTDNAIYAINEDGEVISEEDDYKGTEILGEKNIDWEDIAIGPEGTLLLADTGNNCFCRDNLKILVVPEPESGQESTEVLYKYPVSYPPPEGISRLLFIKVPDVEAIFMLNDAVHVITKETQKARLFKLENPKEEQDNLLVETDQFEFDERVTGADVSPDGNLLAVLTTSHVWVFELTGTETPFQNTYSKTKLRGYTQIESITFSGENLIIAEERGHLYRIPFLELSEPVEN